MYYFRCRVLPYLSVILGVTRLPVLPLLRHLVLGLVGHERVHQLHKQLVVYEATFFITWNCITISQLFNLVLKQINYS